MKNCKWNDERIDQIINEALSKKIVFNDKHNEKIEYVESAIQISRVFNNGRFIKPFNPGIIILALFGLMFSILSFKTNSILSISILVLTALVLLFIKKQNEILPKLEGMTLKYKTKDNKIVAVTFNDSNVEYADTYTTLSSYLNLDKTINNLKDSSQVLFTNIIKTDDGYSATFNNKSYTFNELSESCIDSKVIKLEDLITINLIEDYVITQEITTILSYPLLHITYSKDY